MRGDWSEQETWILSGRLRDATIVVLGEDVRVCEVPTVVVKVGNDIGKKEPRVLKSTVMYVSSINSRTHQSRRCPKKRPKFPKDKGWK